MAQQSFAASVDAWVRETEARMTAVFRESTERVIDAMQTPVGAGGNMPVRDGFLRASIMASTAAPIARAMAKPKEGVAYSYYAGQVALVIAGAEIGDTIYATYGANYARAQEYGAQGRSGRGFVRLAAQRWPAIVAGVVSEAKAVVG